MDQSHVVTVALKSENNCNEDFSEVEGHSTHSSHFYNEIA